MSAGAAFVRLTGRGLHTGAAVELELRRHDGPVGFAHGERLLTRPELEIVRSDRGVRVAHAASGFELELVEHLFAALGGLGIQSGVALAATGPEVPLLGGGALEHADGLRRLGVARCEPGLAVARDAELAHDASVYGFEVGSGVELDVSVEFAETGRERARWLGDAEGFLSDIAPARTFGFAREAQALRDAGRARHVDPDAVLVLDDAGRAVGAARPRQPDELARHKLLDLIGDLYLHGGPPRGRIRALRPGHAATHAVVRRALAEGVLVRRDGG